MKLMVLGTSSNVGKTVITAAFCRHLYRKGISVSPFKGSNLSSRHFITKDDGDIGIEQYIQACACSKEPAADMNPILFRPMGDGIHTIVKGKDAGIKRDTEYLVNIACGSFDRLSKDNEAVICEGSGSPVELNPMENDIANIRMMKERDIPAVIVGDIERGGVFAAIYGTWLLVPEDVRHLLKGFIINRFRGDEDILKGAVDRIEVLTGMRCLGIVPYMELDLPEEDVGNNDVEMPSSLISSEIDRLIDRCNVDFEEMVRMCSDP